MKVIIIFTVATILNVIFSTIRSLCTVKGNEWVASISNAICYGFYCYVVVLTVADFSLIAKIAITALANFVGVFIVKTIEKKARKDKLWKIEVSIHDTDTNAFQNKINEMNIPNGNVKLTNSNWTVFYCYCKTQAESAWVKNLSAQYGGKISAYESEKI